MMEFYFPKLKKKVKAKPVSGKAYRARGDSVRYGLQAMHDGAKSLPKYVSREEYGRLGFSAEQADSELPAYVPKVAYAEEAPVPASPLEDAPSASPEPAEPTNANFSAEDYGWVIIHKDSGLRTDSFRTKSQAEKYRDELKQNKTLRTGMKIVKANSNDEASTPNILNYLDAKEGEDEARMLDETHSDIRDYYTPSENDDDDDMKAVPVMWGDYYKSDNNKGLIYGISYTDGDEIFDMEWFATAKERDDALAEYNEEYGAEIEGEVEYTRREMKDITVDQDVSQTYTVDTDPEDIPKNKMDEVEQAIDAEIEGTASSDPAEYDNVLNDISVDTSVEVPDENGDMVEVSAYGFTDEPMINNEENIREDTTYESFYSESENSIHQFKGESTSCCDAETYRYKSEGDWLCMACDEFQAEFSPEELAKSSAIHGDFDHASINYSGHQNLLARAETVMKDGVYRTTCDCGTVLKWDEYATAITKDGKRIRQEDMSVERLDFPSPEFDHFEEELSMECPTCGEHHICMIEAPVYHDRLKVDFGADSLVEEPDFIPEGDGRAFGQQNSSINLSPLHAENNSTYESQSEGMSRNAKMALGFTAIGLGIAAWKGKELVSLFDNLKEQIKKMTDK